MYVRMQNTFEIHTPYAANPVSLPTSTHLTWGPHTPAKSCWRPGVGPETAWAPQNPRNPVELSSTQLNGLDPRTTVVSLLLAGPAFPPNAPTDVTRDVTPPRNDRPRYPHPDFTRIPLCTENLSRPINEP